MVFGGADGLQDGKCNNAEVNALRAMNRKMEQDERVWKYIRATLNIPQLIDIRKRYVSRIPVVQ